MSPITHLLLASIATLSGQVKLTNALYSCADSSVYFRGLIKFCNTNGKFEGQPVRTAQAGDFNDCVNICNQDELHKSFQYNSTSKTCNVFSSMPDVTTTGLLSPEANMHVGWKHDTCSQVASENGTAGFDVVCGKEWVQGEWLATVGAQTFRDCANLCSADENCQLFAFGTLNRNCWRSYSKGGRTMNSANFGYGVRRVVSSSSCSAVTATKTVTEEGCCATQYYDEPY